MHFPTDRYIKNLKSLVSGDIRLTAKQTWAYLQITSTFCCKPNFDAFELPLTFSNMPVFFIKHYFTSSAILQTALYHVFALYDWSWQGKNILLLYVLSLGMKKVIVAASFAFGKEKCYRCSTICLNLCKIVLHHILYNWQHVSISIFSPRPSCKTKTSRLQHQQQNIE